MRLLSGAARQGGGNPSRLGGSGMENRLGGLGSAGPYLFAASDIYIALNSSCWVVAGNILTRSPLLIYTGKKSVRILFRFGCIRALGA